MNTTFTSSSIINLQTEATFVLKTVLLLNEKFAPKYVADILRGRGNFLRIADHSQLETFGAMPKNSEEYVLNLVDYLIEDGHLKVKDSNGILAVNEKGKRLLEVETELWAEKTLLYSSPTDLVLIEKFKRLRKEWAEMAGKPPYELFSDYTLRRIVKTKPMGFNVLKAMNLLTQTTLFEYGTKIITAIEEVMQNLPDALKQEMEKRVLLPKYQTIKSVFSQEKGLMELKEAANQSLMSTVICLTELHETGNINLKPWIQKHIPNEDLERGMAYFQMNEGDSLKNAHWNTGIEYEILRFCRVYQAA